MTRVPVSLGDRSYQVHIGAFTPAEIAETLAAAVGKVSGLAVLVDQNLLTRAPRSAELVAALTKRLSPVPVHTIALAPGESCKTLSELEKTCQAMAERGLDRGAAVLGLGGGAATDHAGFAASVYLRGVRYVSVPTTLLAMVDASVGGKTAVDLPAGKNLVGAFHQPSCVVADLNMLDTLPAREVAAGLAEVVKAGLIADAALLETLERQAAKGALDRATLEEVITAAVKVKAEVVSGDEKESGRRAILNFGHTIGHAVESASGYDLLHGEAVSLGMIAALALGIARGVTEPSLLPRTRALLEALKLPTDVGRRLDAGVLARIEVDKKRRSNDVRFVFVPRAGEAILQDVPLAEVKAQVLAALQ